MSDVEIGKLGIRLGGGAKCEVEGSCDPPRIPWSIERRTGSSGAASSGAACRIGREGRRSGSSTPTRTGWLTTLWLDCFMADDKDGGGKISVLRLG